MILKQTILLNNEECQSIIWCKTNNITDWDMNDRKYYSKPINYDDSTKWLFEKLKCFFETGNDIEIINFKKPMHFHKFVKGDWFGKHNDERDSRLYGIGVLLNDDFEGGDFKLYNPNEVKLDKVIGNTYIFDVKIDHEITPIIEGERYSLLWFLQNTDIKVNKEKLI
jgi:hypothetical protein